MTKPVKPVETYPPANIEADHALINKYRKQFKGCWVAVWAGKLVAVDLSRSNIRHQIGHSPATVVWVDE